MTGSAETAAAAYVRNAKAVAEKISRLQRAVAHHAARHVAKPADWGFVGDLAVVNQTLDNALDFLQNGGGK